MREEPPFTYCGIDLLGPFVVKDGRKEVKRYGTLYTCLSSRAIHIEVVLSLSTDSFIMSLRRFVGCSGNVRMIRFELVFQTWLGIKWITSRSQISWKKMVVSGSIGKGIHLCQAIWEEFGNGKLGVQEQS